MLSLEGNVNKLKDIFVYIYVETICVRVASVAVSLPVSVSVPVSVPRVVPLAWWSAHRWSARASACSQEKAHRYDFRFVLPRLLSHDFRERPYRVERIRFLPTSGVGDRLGKP